MSKKHTQSNAPEFLSNLLEHSKDILIKQGMEEDYAIKVSREISKKMCELWGGSLIYFPYWLRAEICERDLKIFEEFKGNNHRELSRKYQLSIQVIYRIVNTVRSEEIARRQSTLDL